MEGVYMNEYDLLGGLHNIIDEDTDKKIKKWLEEHNVNYYLLYPLAYIELSLIHNEPEHTDNFIRRGVTAFLYSKVVENGKEVYIKKFNIPGFKRFAKLYNQDLVPLYQNYRFSKEINDINPFTKAKLVPITNNKYRLTTSFVYNNIDEEQFYFYGEDDPEKCQKEKIQTCELHKKFWNKIILEQNKIDELEKCVDIELYTECIKIIEKDLNKWEANVRSKVFDNPKQITYVIAYFYYEAMLKSIYIRIILEYESDDYNIGADCIMKFEMDKCINEIHKLSNISCAKIKKIVDYFVNNGSYTLLEFPLFKIGDTLITIPSLFLVNDWQFTIINGHYIKNNIQIVNRKNTISVVTEKRISKTIENVTNIAIAIAEPYSYLDENGEYQNSDIDFAIYDMKRNTILIIEAKWIDKHYKDEIDKRYGKILETLNEIFSKQITKHKEYLNDKNNINALFSKDKRYSENTDRPLIHYLAVDKRNQLHINDRHMISEYMLIYFLKKHIQDNDLNIINFWEEISSFQTKVDYFSSSDEYYEIPVGDNTILVEQSELYWDS